MRRTLLVLALLPAILITTAMSTPVWAAGTHSDSTAEGSGVNKLPPPPSANEAYEEFMNPAKLPLDTSNLPTSTPKVKAVSTWPIDGVHVIVPPREARLTFDKPVRPVDITLMLTNIGGDAPAKPQPATRSQTDIKFTSVRFSLPDIGPGVYKATWTAGKSTGEYIFTVDKPIEAPGGGNHRHDSGLLQGASIAERFALAGTLFIAAFAPFLRGRRRIIIAGTVLAVAVASVLQGIALVKGSWFQSDGTESLMTGLAAPGLWSWLTVIAVSILLAAAPGLRLSLRLAAMTFIAALVATALNVHTVAAKSVLATTSAFGATTALLALVVLTQRYHYRSAASTRTDSSVDAETNTAGLQSTWLDIALVTTAGLASLIAVWARGAFSSPSGAFTSAMLSRAGTTIALVLLVILASRLHSRTLSGRTNTSGPEEVTTSQNAEPASGAQRKRSRGFSMLDGSSASTTQEEITDEFLPVDRSQMTDREIVKLDKQLAKAARDANRTGELDLDAEQNVAPVLEELLRPKARRSRREIARMLLPVALLALQFILLALLIMPAPLAAGLN